MTSPAYSTNYNERPSSLGGGRDATRTPREQMMLDRAMADAENFLRRKVSAK